MSRLNHPNVLRFFGLVVEGPMVVGIMTGACCCWRGAVLCCAVLRVGGIGLSLEEWAAPALAQCLRSALCLNEPPYLPASTAAEFAAAGSLAQYLRSGVGFIPLKQRAQLALHAVNGMAYLHSLKVVVSS